MVGFRAKNESRTSQLWSRITNHDISIFVPLGSVHCDVNRSKNFTVVLYLTTLSQLCRLYNIELVDKCVCWE
jgi:hypothetical protein